uniref:RNase H type-1 domain-containing protein n=1 Tax=Chenopodium quinoa TaxID=63459 RepID=A0A803M0Q4_CHEQI
MLKVPKSFEDHDLGNIIRDVASLLERDWTVTVFHASRSVNFVADRLATMGRTKFKTGERVPYSYPPADVFETYASEISEMQAA